MATFRATKPAAPPEAHEPAIGAANFVIDPQSMNFWYWMDLGGRILAVAMAFHLILRRRREPQSILAWTLAFFLVPYAALVLYALFGNPVLRVRTRRVHQAAAHDPVMLPGARAVPEDPLGKIVHRVLGQFNAYPARPGNRVWLSDDGEQFFAQLFADVAAAQQRIHLAFYLIRPDATGERLRELLIERAEAGVEVRLIYDHIGSFRTARRWFRPLLRAGAEVYPFLPVNLFRRQLHFNLRNHRKLVIIDGRIAYGGGMNVGDEYRTGNSRWGRWCDLGCRIEGPAVYDFDHLFSIDWFVASRKHIRCFAPPAADPKGTMIQVVAGGPDDPLEEIGMLYGTVIARANHSFVAATPYFVPDMTTVNLLRGARLRGCDCNLYLPRVSNHPWVQLATESFLGDVLPGGVTAKRYAPGMLHTKALLCDRRLGVIGSPNLDVRSFRLNFELAMVLYDTADLAQLAEVFRRIDAESRAWEDPVYRRRPRLRRFWAAVARVFGPIL